jgi:hypothetical protein
MKTRVLNEAGAGKIGSELPGFSATSGVFFEANLLLASQSPQWR